MEPRGDDGVDLRKGGGAVIISCGGLTIEGATVIIHGHPVETAKWQVGYMQVLHCTEVDSIHYLDEETKIIDRVFTAIPLRDVPVNDGATIWTVAPTEGSGIVQDRAVLKSLRKFEDFPADTNLERDFLGIVGYEEFTAYMVAINETDQKMVVLKDIDWRIAWHVLWDGKSGTPRLGEHCKVSFGHTVTTQKLAFPIVDGTPANAQKRRKSGLKTRGEPIQWL